MHEQNSNVTYAVTKPFTHSDLFTPIAEESIENMDDNYFLTLELYQHEANLKRHKS
jgi:hypothetical protein